MTDKLHIPAPPKRASSPGAAYCGLVMLWTPLGATARRAEACVLAAAGMADQLCPTCLAAMLADATRPEEAGRKGGQTRRDRLTPEQRKAAAARAASIRWRRPDPTPEGTSA